MQKITSFSHSNLERWSETPYSEVVLLTRLCVRVRILA